jgi:DNA-binding CsgD family transcriptional regulator
MYSFDGATVAGSDPGSMPSRPSTRAIRASDVSQSLPLSILTTGLWLTLWVAFGSLVLSLVGGLGAHPARRVIVGSILVLASYMALASRHAVCRFLWGRPRLVLVVAAAQLVAAAVDGVVGGPYVAFTLTSIGLAVVVAPPRIVWQCVGLLDCGYLVAVLLGQTPAQLIRGGSFAGVVGQAIGYPFAALILLALSRLFRRFVLNADAIVNELREGIPALTPMLSEAIARSQRALPAPSEAPGTAVRLTPSEVRVVEGLAQGSAPKQLALALGVSLATVRTHIKHAKRKTGARTLPELAGLVSSPGWPELPDGPLR